MEAPLFDGFDPVPDPLADLGQDARRTRRRLDVLTAGRHPVTGLLLHVEAAPVEDRTADGLRCETCQHCQSLAYHGRTYVKCAAFGLTHGPGTDTCRWYPACARHETGEA